MCNYDCCQSKSPIAKRLAARRLLEIEEEESRKPKIVLATPQSLLYRYDIVEVMAAYIVSVSEIRPKYGIISGALLTPITSLIEDPVSIPFENIPHFPLSHLGDCKFLVGYVMGAPVIAMADRFHQYDGYPMATCSLPVRVMQLCGVKTIMLTCCSLAANPNYQAGDIMLIKDHINFIGMMSQSPMEGPSDPRFGARFFPMVNAYNADLIKAALEIGKAMGINKALHSGVFAFCGGPHRMSVSEESLLHRLGADAIGPSLVPEVLAAHHAGIKIFAFAFITVVAYSRPTEDEDEDHRTAAKAAVESAEVTPQKRQACTDLIGRLIYHMHHENVDSNCPK
ncbi:purine nucleoside phosphorylase [Drosophila bipectinata]|uniref:purine nucleoside phosphorylase n=1 Tax=Drosophila bipectinata TaxID=42026 RepID=UPI001C89E44B|nr:purine nucleoside phosphorylase [Drosophila bipectinata]